MIPRSLLDDKNADINVLVGKGQELLTEMLQKVTWNSIPELRNKAIEVMNEVSGEVSNLAAARAAEFYDEVRVLSVGKPVNAYAIAGRDPRATAGAVRALVQSVVNTGERDAFIKSLCARLDYEARRATGYCSVHNGKTDVLRPRFARVPSGAETCPFCIMLASRGFVYHSAETAGALCLDHYHPHCDCSIVQGYDTYFNGPSRRWSTSTVIEGYDTDALYEQYLQDLHDGKLSSTSVQKYAASKPRWGSTKFSTFNDFRDFLKASVDIEDLQMRCAIAEEEARKAKLSDSQFRNLQDTVMGIKQELEKT